MKKRNNEENNNDKILSFPDKKTHNTELPLNDIKKDQSRINKSANLNFGRGILYGGLILFFVCIILFITRDNSFNGTNTVNTEPISLSTANNYDFKKYREGYILARDGHISCFNTNQELQWDTDAPKTAPKIKVNNKYCIVCYPDSEVAVVTNGNTTNRIKSPGKIQYGYVNQRGYTVLFTEESGLKNNIIVYNKRGEQIYLRQNADSNIPFAVLSDNNHDLITIETKSKDEDFYSEIKVVDIREKDKTKANIQFGKEVIGGLFFYTKKDFLIISEGGIYSYSLNGKLNWKIDLSSKPISMFAYNGEDIVAVVFNEDDSANSPSEVCFYNTKGKTVSSYKTPKKVYDIDVCQKTAMIRMERQLLTINTKGKYISSSDVAFDIKDSVFMATKKCTLVLTNADEIKLLPVE